MTKKYGFWSGVGDFFGAVLAPTTGGASLLMSPTARNLVSKIISSGEDNDSANKKLEEWKIQNEQWKTQMEANRAEVESLRKERAKTDNDIKKNNDEIARFRAVVNNPHSTEEEKKNAKKRIVLLENENKRLKKQNQERDKKIEEKSQTTPAPSKPWSFPKLGVTDKVIIAGGMVLIIYLLIPSEKKK